MQFHLEVAPRLTFFLPKKGKRKKRPPKKKPLKKKGKKKKQRPKNEVVSWLPDEGAKVT
jgi:hypothetical protein